DPIETIGEISWIGESKKRVGVRFIDLPEKVREQIQRWISLQTDDVGRDAENGSVSSSRGSHSQLETEERADDEDADHFPVARKFRTGLDAKQQTPERRSQVRKPVNASAYLRLTDGNAGLVSNVSETGLSFRVAKVLEGDRIFVRFQLPDSDRFIESPALIVWRSASKKKVGARFVSLPEDARKQIVEWIGPLSSENFSAAQTSPSQSVSETGVTFGSSLPSDMSSTPQHVSGPGQFATAEAFISAAAKLATPPPGTSQS